MDLENIKCIIEGDTATSIKALDTFISRAEGMFTFPELNDNGLRRALWNSLYNLVICSKDDQVQTNCFSCIRILSRDKKNIDELVEAQDWLGLIKKFSKLDDPNYKFTEQNKIQAIAAEKSLCNLLFNSKKAAKNCWSSGILCSINERLTRFSDTSFPREIIYFDVKVMFIITALCPETRKPLRDDKLALIKLMEILNQIVLDASSDDNGILTNDSIDLACEILKTLFNLTVHMEATEEEVRKCAELVKLLRVYLLVDVASFNKRTGLLNDVINLLTNMADECYSELITPLTSEKPMENSEYLGFDMIAIKKILELLQNKIGSDTPVGEQLEIISPTVTVLFKAARSDRIIRRYIRSEILPPLKDVHTRPEEGTTLRNCLCRLLTTPITQLRDIVAEFLFFLCKKSVRRMIKYTGYGNAAGLFANRGLLGGKEDEEAAEFSSDSEDSETEEYAEHKHNINPVLGCYKSPHMNAMEGMTDEQKEYEAMKLVELMDNLTKSGPIRPCRVGKDGKPEPIEHVLQLQNNMNNQRFSGQDLESD